MLWIHQTARITEGHFWGALRAELYPWRTFKSLEDGNCLKGKIKCNAPPNTIRVPSRKLGFLHQNRATSTGQNITQTTHNI